MSPGSILKTSNLFVVSRSDYDRANSTSASSTGTGEFWRASFECNRQSPYHFSSEGPSPFQTLSILSPEGHVKYNSWICETKKYHRYREKATFLFSKSCISKNVTFYCLIAFNTLFPTLIVLKPNPLDFTSHPFGAPESVAKIRFHTVSSASLLVQRAT